MKLLENVFSSSDGSDLGSPLEESQTSTDPDTGTNESEEL